MEQADKDVAGLHISKHNYKKLGFEGLIEYIRAKQSQNNTTTDTKYRAEHDRSNSKLAKRQ